VEKVEKLVAGKTSEKSLREKENMDDEKGGGLRRGWYQKVHSKEKRVT